MTTITSFETERLRVPAGTVRLLSLGAAAVVFIDAWSVGAPFLAFLGIPFLIGALALRRLRGPGSIALGLWSLFDVAIAANYAIANGFDAEGGWADLLGVYVGGSCAAAIVVLVVRSFIGGRAPTQ